VFPLATPVAAGVTTIKASVGATMGVTVSVAEPVMLLYWAPIVVDPGRIARAAPLGKMVATEGAELLQVVVPVTSCVLASVNVAVAVNCCVDPVTRLALAGVTVTDAATAAVTCTVEVVAD
jgi:hypothetical protein